MGAKRGVRSSSKSAAVWLCAVVLCHTALPTLAEVPEILSKPGLYPPSTPRPPAVKEGSVTATSVVLGWEAPQTGAGNLDGYGVQVRRVGTGDEGWWDVPGAVKGIPGANHREIQEVVSRADPGESITSGYFRLSLNWDEGADLIGPDNDFDPESATQTPHLAFDASEDDMKAALEFFDNIGVVEVRRYGPDEQGGYRWKVTLDWEMSAPRGDLPMLVVSDVKLDAQYTSGGSAVLVREVRKGTSGPSYCKSGDQCEHRIGALSPYTQYQFRVRARNPKGWSEWSAPSTVTRTSRTEVPATPNAPVLSGVPNAHRIVLELPDDPPRPSGDNEPLSAWQVQYQPVDGPPGMWYSLPTTDAAAEAKVYAAPGEVSSTYPANAGTVPADGLAPSTQYRFRTRAVNRFGAGAWSAPSAVMSTAPGPPPAPIVHDPPFGAIGDTWVELSWDPPAEVVSLPATQVGGQATRPVPVEKYAVQYRISDDDEWIMAEASIDAVAVSSVRDVQEVTTRVDPGMEINGGTWQLSLNAEGAADVGRESMTRTVPLAWDAEASEVREALEALAPVGPVEVRRFGPDARGGFTWRITLDWGSGVGQTVAGVGSGGASRPAGSAATSPEVRTNVPLFVGHGLQLKGGVWTGPGSSVVVRRVRSARSAEMVEQPHFTVTGLEPGEIHVFRVRAESARGVGPWSAPTARVRTVAAPVLWSGMPVDLDFDAQAIAEEEAGPQDPLPRGLGARSLSADRHEIAHAASSDPAYVAGVGVGGAPHNAGGHGLAEFTTYSYDSRRAEVDRVSFFYRPIEVYGETAQTFVVPESGRPGTDIHFVDVKLWGAGGGGGFHPDGYGGGGGFVQGKVAAKTGDVFYLRVGGGGHGVTSGSAGMGGFNGGGDGGNGDYGGGGGGGATSLHAADGRILMIAAGGGGGGSSDYCCAHGGGAGAGDLGDGVVELGQSGLSPESTPRDNTGDLAPPRNEYNDERDETGFPAHHQHLDHGFAPEADLSVIALGGGGAAPTDGGDAGRQGSYEFRLTGELRKRSFVHGGDAVNDFGDEAAVSRHLAGALSAVSTSGQKLQGGRGGSSKEAGGGGGGGWFGGGGGGAGVDGAGGGGGVSYIRRSALYAPPLGPETPPAPTVVSVDATSVELSWPGVRVGPRDGLLADEYYLSMSYGTHSHEFFTIMRATKDERSFFKTGLHPRTTYRFRLTVATTNEGPLAPGPPVTVTTLGRDTNGWERVTPRAVGQGRAGSGRRAVDAPTAEVALLPSPMQGASFTPVLDWGFLFGGRSTGEDCDQAIMDYCRLGVGVRNDVWRFDPITDEWLQLDVIGQKPAARERHIAANIGGNLVIFGGSDTPDDTGGGGEFFQDLWELDPDADEEERWYSYDTDPLASEGQEIPEGEIFSRHINVETPLDRCVVETRVMVRLYHPCLSDLRVTVSGPIDVEYREPSRDFALGERHPLGLAQGEPTLLFMGGLGSGVSSANPSLPCFDEPANQQNNATEIWFYDDAERSASVCCPPGGGPRGEWHGDYRPLDSLSRFREQPPTGEWKLDIYDKKVNGRRGRIFHWAVEFRTAPCNREYEWILRHDGFGLAPEARHDATGCVVDRSWYVMGGRAETETWDLWRYDYDLNAWQDLDFVRPTDSDHLVSHLGRTGMVSPWGILSWGGRAAQQHHLAEPMLWRYDPVSLEWVTTYPPHRDSPLHTIFGFEADPVFLDANLHDYPRHLEIDLSGSAAAISEHELPVFPGQRMHHAWALFGVYNTQSRARGVKLPVLYVYGGYDGAVILDDLWRIHLRNPSNEVDRHQDDQRGISLEDSAGGFLAEEYFAAHCAWRVRNTTAYEDTWLATCGASSRQPCSFDDILTQAYCTREYQSIGYF